MTAVKQAACPKAAVRRHQAVQPPSGSRVSKHKIRNEVIQHN